MKETAGKEFVGRRKRDFVQVLPCCQTSGEAGMLRIYGQEARVFESDSSRLCPRPKVLLHLQSHKMKTETEIPACFGVFGPFRSQQSVGRRASPWRNSPQVSCDEQRSLSENHIVLPHFH